MCPNCGKENELPQFPQPGVLIRCGYCGQEFSANASQSAAAETENTPQDIAKDLAQTYFSDIPDAAFAKDRADGSGKVWSSEEEEISDAERKRQQQRLYQFAQELAEKKGTARGRAGEYFC